MTYKEFIGLTIDSLASLYPKEEGKAIAVRLLEHFLGIAPYKTISEGNSRIAHAKLESLSSALDELKKGRPLQYVLGFTLFGDNKFKVKEGVLIPRPETEELFRLIVDDCSEIELDEGQEFNILDVCTGSGCLAYSLAAEFPTASVYGCDISEGALRIASKQKIALSGGRPVIFWADVLTAPPAGLPKFDLIVSNPPYVLDSERALMRPNVLDYEPSLALFVPDDDPLKFYKALKVWCDFLLRDGGRCYFEINEVFGPQCAALFPNSEVLKDFNDKDRFIRFHK